MTVQVVVFEGLLNMRIVKVLPYVGGGPVLAVARNRGWSEGQWMIGIRAVSTNRREAVISPTGSAAASSSRIAQPVSPWSR